MTLDVCFENLLATTAYLSLGEHELQCVKISFACIWQQAGAFVVIWNLILPPCVDHHIV